MHLSAPALVLLSRLYHPYSAAQHTKALHSKRVRLDGILRTRLLSRLRSQRGCQHHYIGVARQREAFDGLGVVEREGITVQVERALIERAVRAYSIRLCLGRGFAGIALGVNQSLRLCVNVEVVQSV